MLSWKEFSNGNIIWLNHCGHPFTPTSHPFPHQQPCDVKWETGRELSIQTHREPEKESLHPFPKSSTLSKQFSSSGTRSSLLAPLRVSPMDMSCFLGESCAPPAQAGLGRAAPRAAAAFPALSQGLYVRLETCCATVLKEGVSLAWKFSPLIHSIQFIPHSGTKNTQF